MINVEKQDIENKNLIRSSQGTKNNVDWSTRPFGYFCLDSSGLDVCTAVRRWTNVGRLVRKAGSSSRMSLVQTLAKSSEILRILALEKSR